VTEVTECDGTRPWLNFSGRDTDVDAMTSISTGCANAADALAGLQHIPALRRAVEAYDHEQQPPRCPALPEPDDGDVNHQHPQ
jgi:hypothetical protein